MNNTVKTILSAVIIGLSLSSCGNDETKTAMNEGGGEAAQQEEGHEESGGEGLADQQLHLSQQRMEAMGIKMADSLPEKSLSNIINVTGELEVPPENEASVTAVIGANVTGIEVIEGDKVSKGTVLAYLSHPDLIRLQTDYRNAVSSLEYLEKEYERQEKLYEEEITSGKIFQQARSQYLSAQAKAQGLEAQLKMLGVNRERIRNGEIYNQVPVISPIDGFVEAVNIKLGQFVQPQTELFEIVNTDHVHAVFMVFEKDVAKVKEGQKVTFNVASSPDRTIEAEIYSVGKTFEEDPKAVHVHAEIEGKVEGLIPGMYLDGKIETSNNKLPALPEEAVIGEEGKSYIFTATAHEENGETEWAFSPVEVVTGIKADGWVGIKLLKPINPEAQIVMNNAYYLISELKKGENEHEH